MAVLKKKPCLTISSHLYHWLQNINHFDKCRDQNSVLWRD